jgi:hypothetical protein
MADKEFIGMNAVDPDWSEHSHPARSKKVIDGPMIVPIDSVNAINVKPIVDTVDNAPKQMTLQRGKAYRLISSGGGAYIRFAVGGVASADATDIYLPPNVYVTVVCDYWTRLNFVKVTTAGNFIQAIEVE